MKKLIALLLAVCMLTGCQLASEEQNEKVMDDKLVGVLVTFDDLDLSFDLEGYIRDNGMPDDGEIITDGSAYEDRLYAEVGDRGYEFPGVDGLVMAQMWEEDHWAGFSTEGFSGISTRVNTADTKDGVEEEGTVCLPNDTENFIFYVNPIFMTADGKYYATQGDSFSSNSVGGGMWVDQELTWTEDETEYGYSAKFGVEVKGVDIADKVVVVQMSAEHEKLASEEYVPGQMPESVTPAEGTAYIIAEEWAGENVTRTMYQPEDDSIIVFYRGEQVYCLSQHTQILWAE